MDEKFDGVIVWQVGVDRVCNIVIVWVIFDKKEIFYNFFEIEQGKDDYGESEDMSCIEFFEMYDFELVSERLFLKV